MRGPVKYHIKPRHTYWGIHFMIEVERPPDPWGLGNPAYRGTLLHKGTLPTVVYFPNNLERLLGITMDMKYQKAYNKLRKILDRMEAKDREAQEVVQRGDA
jgi:hypothetical protein